ncbi:MAG: asparaginase [Candidatus Thorarchaeota archaeon]
MTNDDTFKVCLIATGGTISSVYDSGTESLKPGLSVDTLLDLLPKGMRNIEVIQKDILQIDSANMQPHHWQKIASEIKKVNDETPDLQGFVVTHGTDTMVYSAAAVSLMVQDLGKPIIFTGSQIPASVPWSDGPRNLLDALRVAAFADLGETCIVFNGEIHRATRAKKVRVNSYDAFDSMDPTPIGVLARDVVLYEGSKKRHEPHIKYAKTLDDMVFLLKLFPGQPPDIIRKIVEMDFHGIVVEGFGSGNIPSGENALANEIKDAVNKGCFVVISSQCAFGQADLSLYEVGRAALDVGAISAYDMTSEAALVKLAWVLGHGREPNLVKEMMQTNYVGEVSFGLAGLTGS